MNETPTDRLRRTLSEAEAKIRAELPHDWTYERLIAAARGQVSTIKGWQALRPESLIDCLLVACRAGVMPDGDRAYIRRLGSDYVYEPDYKGLVEIAKRSNPEIGAIHADCIYQRDYYEYERGSAPKLVHRPLPLGEDRGKKVGAYAIVRYRYGDFEATDCDESYLAQCRKMSRSSARSQWEDEMDKKSILKRLLKWQPMNDALATAVAADNRFFDLNAANGNGAEEKPKDRDLSADETAEFLGSSLGTS